MRKGRIFVISAPSGSGKTTICERVLKKVTGLAPSVSMTTRRPRRGEKDKKDYYYLPKKDFNKEIEKGNFLEWEENFGSLYGTPRKFVLKKIKEGKDVLLSIDVKGAMKVKSEFPESVLIFVKPPSKVELLRRLTGRNTDKKTEIAKRLRLATTELGYAAKYDHVVINKDLGVAVGKIIDIIKKERNNRNGTRFHK